MGFKYDYRCNAVPARIKDNKLYCDLLLKDKYIEVNADGIDFPEQLVNFKNDNVMCYLQNGDYEIALRFNGSGCLVQNGMLRRSFVFEPPKIGFRLFRKGSVDILGAQSGLFNLAIDEDTILTSITVMPVAYIVHDYKHSVFCSNNELITFPMLTYSEYYKWMLDLNGNKVGDVRYMTDGFKLLGGRSV